MKTMMLKLAAMLAIGMAVSCDVGETDNSIPESPVLVKKVTETIHAGDFTETRTTNFNYSGNRLISIATPGSVSTLNYVGEKIVSATQVTDAGPTKTIAFTYNGDELVSIADDGEFSETTDFTYIGNALSGETTRYLDNAEWIIDETREFTFNANSNLVAEIVNRNGTNYRSEYTFDSHFMPFRYMPVPMRLILSFEGINPKNANNPLTRTNFTPATATTPSGTQFYEMQYNAAGYPIQIIKLAADGDLISTTLIEYL